MQQGDESKYQPTESHVTAAWANIERLAPVSHIPIPHPSEVENAKEWVDSNQK
ncbi:MAG: DUF3787 domain-containing protein [Peptococcaceae bacterium]|nr:DUF3787 domain-containing protein [Peptococcaceae bacterium]